MRKWERTWGIYNGKQSQVEEEKQRKPQIQKSEEKDSQERLINPKKNLLRVWQQKQIVQ